eukprot:6208520-Pleurochrysis_carterae.AAC.2
MNILKIRFSGGSVWAKPPRLKCQISCPYTPRAIPSSPTPVSAATTSYPSTPPPLTESILPSFQRPTMDDLAKWQSQAQPAWQDYIASEHMKSLRNRERLRPSTSPSKWTQREFAKQDHAPRVEPRPDDMRVHTLNYSGWTQSNVQQSRHLRAQLYLETRSASPSLPDLISIDLASAKLASDRKRANLAIYRKAAAALARYGVYAGGSI